VGVGSTLRGVEAVAGKRAEVAGAVACTPVEAEAEAAGIPAVVGDSTWAVVVGVAGSTLVGEGTAWEVDGKQVAGAHKCCRS
jgi:hypothetical protein